MTQRYRTNFGSSLFAQLMAATGGRAARVVAGIALIGLGVGVVGGTGGLILAVVGLVPLIAGAVDVCIFSALFGGPFRGPDIRACRPA